MKFVYQINFQNLFNYWTLGSILQSLFDINRQKLNVFLKQIVSMETLFLYEFEGKSFNKSVHGCIFFHASFSAFDEIDLKQEKRCKISRGRLLKKARAFVWSHNKNAPKWKSQIFRLIYRSTAQKKNGWIQCKCTNILSVQSSEKAKETAPWFRANLLHLHTLTVLIFLRISSFHFPRVIYATFQLALRKI